MADSKSNGISEGGLLTTLLLVLFITLKLCGVINWSWLWVLSPFWIPFALAICVGVLYFIVKINQEEKKPAKSKWQEKMEEMQRKQAEMQKYHN